MIELKKQSFIGLCLMVQIQNISAKEKQFMARILKQFFILTSLPTKIHENVLKVTNVLRKAFTGGENTKIENNKGILYRLLFVRISVI